ncbi:MAG: alpha-glucan phosphorylase, partial [Oscillospiraceae bacterium]
MKVESLLEKVELRRRLIAALRENMMVEPKDATIEQFYRALALTLRDLMGEKRRHLSAKTASHAKKQVHYLSMEFLPGRSMKNSLYNLRLDKVAAEVLSEWDVRLEQLYECEPDAGLGNGGLGRLAACYLDGLATDGFPAAGYSILYKYGIFKQKIIDG